MTVQQQNYIKPIGIKLVTSKIVFTITLVVIVLTILSIWLFGLGQHRTIFENSILSTTILSIAFFLFLTIGLYKGIKLKDDIGKLTNKIKIDKISNLSDSLEFPSDIPDVGEGIAGIILGILAWFLFSILLLIFIWFFGAIIWTMILVFVAMLYWIFFRALRLVFKKSNKCKGKLTTSIVYGLGYTTLYNFWIYGIILATHYLTK
ncbi:hypothetical protein [Flavobacterium filum]|uniref:hypothetical protein n=1 Tax=Flavobacterium filum TaxID=370974 RepID=UPI0023F2A991|nr:hypothetical protein [Flavobacterium filum]